jgi:hypothetical protein
MIGKVEHKLEPNAAPDLIGIHQKGPALVCRADVNRSLCLDF